MGLKFQSCVGFLVILLWLSLICYSWSQSLLSAPLRWHLLRLTLYPGTCSPCTGKNCIVQPDKAAPKSDRQSHAFSIRCFLLTGCSPEGIFGVSVPRSIAGCLSALQVIVKLWSGPLFYLTTGLLFIFLASWSSWKYPAAAGRPLALKSAGPASSAAALGPPLWCSPAASCPQYLHFRLSLSLCRLSPVFFLLWWWWWFVYFFMQSLTVLHWSV